MLLDQLDIDVLSHIFILTDVYTIMSLSKVNKSFHAIARAKHLWVSVVRDLYARRLIDLGVHEVLEECSTQMLIDKVRRVVLGPYTWSPSSPIAPTICRQMTLLLDSPRMRFELVPGGKYLVLFVSKGSAMFGFGGDVDVECLEVASGRRVWSWGRPGHRVSHTEFDFSGCGSEAVACVTFSDNEEPFRNQILFLSINVETGDTDQLLGLPELPFVIGRPQISGNFFVCAVSAGTNSSEECIVLVNWRTAHFIILNMKSAQFRLLHGHLITIQRSSESTLCLTNYLRVYSISTLHPFWHPVYEFDIDTRTSPREILSLVSETICADDPSHHLHISVAESALHQQTYELIISLVDLAASPPLSRFKKLRNRLARRRPRNEWMTTLFRYYLTLPPLLDENPRLRLKSTLQHSLPCVPSYRAGYGLWAVPWVISSIVVRHLDEVGINIPRQLPVVEGEAMYQVEMAPSGAVVILYESRAVFKVLITSTRVLLHLVERIPGLKWPANVPAQGQRIRARSTPRLVVEGPEMDFDDSLGMEPILPIYDAPWKNPLPVTTIIPPKEDALRALDLTTRDPVYQRSTWYTDGSLLEGRAGGAAVRVEDGVERERVEVPLGRGQVCEGEMEGLVRALERAVEDGCTSVLCVVDSQAALKGITSTAPRSGQFRAVHYDRLVRGALRRRPDFSIVNLWTPAHIGTAGNELADEAAKHATLAEPDPSLFISLTTTRQLIHRLILDLWKERWSRSKTGRQLRAIDQSPPTLIPLALYSSSSLSRKMSSAVAQLRTDFSPLNAYRFKAGLTNSPACDACGAAKESRAHFILDCPVWEPHRQPLYGACYAAGFFGSLHLAPLLNEPKVLTAFSKFLDATGRFA
ncbi:hypothetical protein C8F04DRAFT_1398250 [Mycena alexandri]|uniref:RNase H type-1 domain-containing protein n=1 Tax=Mycena alexandri TaxID=1745969 RepID=A0AAD6SNU9_9AGAR|nr:hypothetical protein C8F04DRAFT_1398250 [Mycena alexandri]